jgi:hypothetical protein
MPQFRPAAVIDAIARHGITDIVVVPSMLQSLLDDPSFEPARVKSLTASRSAPRRCRPTCSTARSPPGRTPSSSRPTG